VAEPGLIAAYLAELRYSLTRLPDADEIAAEAEDHLFSTADALVAAGRPRPQAETEALARFGSASLVARVFVEESKRGGAVSTRLTRRAGAAAMLAPLFVAVGQAGNLTIDRGTGHGAGVALIVAGFAAFAFALWGVRRRHGGLAGWGRAAFWLFVASPFIAFPFGWGAGGALVVVQLLVVTLLGIGMIRARVLPVPAVALFTLAPAATVAVAALLTVMGLDAARYAPIGVVAFAVGFAWVGWAMWREPALDLRSPNGGPLAA